MKIAIVFLGAYPSTTGASGAERRVTSIAKGLQEQEGCSVTMLLRRRENDPESSTYGKLKLRYLGPICSRQTFSTRMAFWKKIKTTCLREEFDWVLFYSVTVDAVPTMRFLRKSGIKVASEMCDLRSSAVSLSSMKKRIFYYLAYKADELLIPRSSDLNIVISSFLKRHVMKHAPSVPAFRLPILCDPETFKPTSDASAFALKKWGIPLDAIVIGYTGSLWSHEGVQYLLEAFKDVIAQNDRVRLIVAGRLETGPGFDDIVEIARKLRIADKLITPGWVGTEDVLAIYSRADMMVLPQTSQKFSVYALPTKLAEYSSMSKAIVATRVGDVPEYFKDEINALLVTADDPKTLALAIEKLAKSEALRKKLGSEAFDVFHSHFNPRVACSHLAAAMAQISRTDHMSTKTEAKAG